MNFLKHIMQRAFLRVKQGESLVLFAKITSKEPHGKISSQQMLLSASIDYNYTTEHNQMDTIPVT